VSNEKRDKNAHKECKVGGEGEGGNKQLADHQKRKKNCFSEILLFFN
jgi:hypothetical protein